MSHSLVEQLNHIVFGTKGRRGLITADIRDEVHAYIGGILRSEKCRLIKAGGMPDHIHLLAELHASLSVADCVKKVKCNSSRWIKIRFPHRRTFVCRTVMERSPKAIPGCRFSSRTSRIKKCITGR